MTIHIDIHVISSVLAVLLIGAMLAIWGRFSLRLPGFILVMCISLTLIVVSQSDLTPGRVQAIFAIGAMFTTLVMLCMFAMLSGRKRRRSMQVAPVAIHYAQHAHAEPVPRRGAVRFVPIPAEDERELEEFEEDEEPEEEYYQVRRPRPRPRYAVTTEEDQPVSRPRRPARRLQYVSQGQQRRSR